MSIFRLRSIASIAMQIYVFPRIPSKRACTAAKNNTSIPEPVRYAKCAHDQCQRALLLSTAGRRRIFFTIPKYALPAVPVCKIHSMNEPRGASSETVAHWLCLNGSGAVIGQETHQLLFYPPNSHLRKALRVAY